MGNDCRSFFSSVFVFPRISRSCIAPTCADRLVPVPPCAHYQELQIVIRNQSQTAHLHALCPNLPCIPLKIPLAIKDPKALLMMLPQ